MREAEEKGLDNISHTWRSIRWIQARKRGERFHEFAPHHFDASWKE